MDKLPNYERGSRAPAGGYPKCARSVKELRFPAGDREPLRLRHCSAPPNAATAYWRFIDIKPDWRIWDIMTPRQTAFHHHPQQVPHRYGRGH